MFDAGGGGALHKDGDPVSVTLDNESVTVPPGETWVVEITSPIRSSDAQDSVKINGITVASEDFHDSSFNTLLEGGDSIDLGDFHSAHVGGWSV